MKYNEAKELFEKIGILTNLCGLYINWVESKQEWHINNVNNAINVYDSEYIGAVQKAIQSFESQITVYEDTYLNFDKAETILDEKIEELNEAKDEMLLSVGTICKGYKKEYLRKEPLKSNLAELDKAIGGNE